METISQGYPQTAGFSSEISSRLESFRHRWKCPVKRLFPLCEKNALDADFLVHLMDAAEHEEVLSQGQRAPGAFGWHRRGD